MDESGLHDNHDSVPSAFVQEAACAAHVIVLKVRVPGRTSLVIVGATRSGTSGAGLITSETRREIWGGRLPPGAVRQRAREDSLALARVVALGPHEAFVDQHGSSRVVRADGGRVIITDETIDGNAKAFVSLSDEDRVALEQRGVEIAQAIAADAVTSRRAEVARILERAVQRIDRRHGAIRGDLDKIERADRIAGQAQWLIAEAAKAPRGATKLVVTDWSTGEAIPLEVPLDPSKSAKDQVAAMFKRAKRLRLGARIANERLDQADKQLAAVRAALGNVNEASSLVALEELLREAKRAAPRDVVLPAGATSTPTKAKHATRERIPYRSFFARSGRRVLVGKGASDNDALTLHVARPHDLWLHAKDRTGAHVVVQLEKGQTCAAEDLVDAAHLAAHFSDARDEKIVDIQYTNRRHLRKPKGSPPGLVVVDREKVLVLRIEPDILRALLEREDL